nr:phage antirepressor [Sphingomonas sp. Y57]
MSAIVPFNFEQHAVRIEDRDGRPWFVAADICAALDITNHRDAVGRLDDDERGSVIVDTNGGPQSVAAVNESGMYALIMRSRKTAAKRFRKWVTAEVLPAIRRTGSYGAPAAGLNLSDPAVLHTLLLEHTGRALAADQRVAQLQPKADALDRLTDADGALCITDAAKALGVMPRRLFQWLERNSWIYRRAGGSHWVGYQARISAGLVEHKVNRIDRGDQPAKFVEQVLITPKGIAKLATENAGK